MAQNRAHLNDLIFHNPVVMPRTSPGFAQVTLAVAELKVGNNAMAARYAGDACIQDPTMAAAWLAKMAADVFQATPADLREDGAHFCMNQALDRAPSCQREITEFFVANIIGHYVEVLCAGALGELAQWMELDTHADRLEDRAGFRPPGYALRLEGKEHRSASMLHLVAARDLIRIAARMLLGEGLPSQQLDRIIREFTSAFREVLGAHLRQTELQLSGPILAAIEGETDSLVMTYGHQPIHSFSKTREIKRNQARTYEIVNAPHPVPRDTLIWLEQMFPDVKTLEAHRLLSFPLFAVSKTLYGINKPHWIRSLQQQVGQTVVFDKIGPALWLLLLVMMLLLVAAVPLLFIWPFGVLTWGFVTFLRRRRRRARQRAHLRAAFSSIWSADTWLHGTLGDLLCEKGTGGSYGQQEPPPLPKLLTLPAGARREKSGLAPSTIILRVCGTLVVLLVALVILGALVGPTAPAPPGKALDSPEAALATNDTGIVKPTPQVRLAIPASSAAAPISSAADSPSASNPDQTYSVVGVSNGDALNVRAGPGVNNRVIARLPNGAAHISVTGTSVMNGSTEWVPIRVGDRTGWATKQHLQRE